MARKFFYVCAGLFLLALSYHLGAGTATAQAPGNPVVGITSLGVSTYVVVTANGDLYGTDNGPGGPWTHKANVFSGGPTPAQHESWGQLKAHYRNAPSTSAVPGAQDK